MNDERYLKKENYIIQYDLNDRIGHLYNTIIQEYLPHIHHNVLHLGCNSGSTTKLLSLYIDRVRGLDIHKEAIDIARENYPDIQFDVGDMRSLPYNDDSCNGVYLLDVLEHIYPEDVDLVIREIHRVMTSGSYFCVFVPTVEWCGANDPSHVMFFSCSADVTNLLVDHFTIIECTNDTRTNPGMGGQHNHWRVLCRKD
jgi:ubiquinone/menaquinone biosynthesis C-methylase UbiE